MLNVVFIVPDLADGGAQRVVLALSTRLLKRGWSVSIDVSTVRGGLPFPESVPIRMGLRRSVIAGLPMVIRRLRVMAPDVVIVTPAYLNLAVLAARWAIPSATAIIVREANRPAWTLSALPRWVRLLKPYRRLYPLADRILAQSAAQAKDLTTLAPASAERIVQMPNPVDTERLRLRATPPSRRPGDGLRLVTAGRLTPAKGIDRLIAAFPTLPKTAALEVFGEGPERERLTAAIRSMGLEDRIFLRGHSGDLPKWIAGADAFVMASRWEGLPNVALEALALGTPILASSASGLDDLVGGLNSQTNGASECSTSVITISEVDDIAKFLAPLSSITPIQERLRNPRPSLLPADYGIERVVDRFEHVLRAAITARQDRR